jgi:hypothetical protein
MKYRRFYNVIKAEKEADCMAMTNDCCAVTIPHCPLPAVLDLTRDGRWSTYDVNVLKLSNVSFRGKCASMGNTLKKPSPTKLAQLGNLPPASPAGRLAGPVFFVLFSGCNGIFKLSKRPGIDFKEPIPPICIIWRNRLKNLSLKIPFQNKTSECLALKNCE